VKRTKQRKFVSSITATPIAESTSKSASSGRQSVNFKPSMHRTELISCCLGFVLGTTLAAQEKLYVPPPRTIEAFVSQALANNAELRVFEAEVAAARGQRTQAGFFKNPEVSAEIGARGSSKLVSSSLVRPSRNPRCVVRKPVPSSMSIPLRLRDALTTPQKRLNADQLVFAAQQNNHS
jgi:hypothetical protein